MVECRWLWWGVVVVWCVVVVVPPVSPCTCELRHPQQHVCDSDFVVFARVRRLTTTPNGNYAYKVKVKKLVKGSEKVELMLQKGLIYTPTYSSACKADLNNRTSYVITGNVVASKPWVTLCNFASPMRSLTPKMKKGVRLLYQSGCDCPIMSCHHWERCPKANFFCAWETVREEEDCQGHQSVCLRGPGGTCDWLKGRVYTRCMKNLRQRQASPRNTTAITDNSTTSTTNRLTPNHTQRAPGIQRTPGGTHSNDNNTGNTVNTYKHIPPRSHGNSINRGVIGYPRRRKPGRFWYKRRLAGGRRLRRPLRFRQRRPGITYLPKTG